MIFNVGFSKTGTTSAEYAMMELNRRVCTGDWKSAHTHFLQALYVSDNIEGLLDFVRRSGYDAFSDAPWCGLGLYKRLDEAFGDAKFILTIRDSEKWFSSLKNMIVKDAGGGEEQGAVERFYTTERYGFASFFVKEFGTDDLASRERIIGVYEKHNQDVLEYFDDKRDKLLVLPTEELDWGPLCDFLHEPVPAVDFPHKNPGIYD